MSGGTFSGQSKDEPDAGVNLGRRDLLKLGVSGLLPGILGVTTGGIVSGDSSTEETIDWLVIRENETTTIQQTTDTSYSAIEWHDRGSLVLESGATLGLTETTT